jgi:hypothetical protein
MRKKSGDEMSELAGREVGLSMPTLHHSGLIRDQHFVALLLECWVQWSTLVS